MWMLALLLAQAAPEPSAEALMLGQRVAETGALAALFPTIAAKETEELLAEHPDWSDADKAALRAEAAVQARRGIARITAAMGRAYAAKLSLADLRAIVAFQTSPAAAHLRAAMPAAMIESMGSLGEMDFKGDVRRAFCTKTGKGCAAK